MPLFHGVRTFFQAPGEMKHLYLEAYLNLAWARLLILLPFSKIAPSLGQRMGETPFVDRPEDQEELNHIGYAIQVMSRHTFWKSQCLVRAIAAMNMLHRRNIDCTLYLGLGKSDEGMIAHALLRSGTRYITGGDVDLKFTIVGKFAKG
ncbi:lasso peptide biosynthesis B2 protein [Sporolactobacillus sp. THM7-4]|nr:lasso peptide biosynthesis B2 protein [Sporolactobacillus sp. THM7-4]